MENKIEIMSNELVEINNIIALARADDDVKKILLNEITREFLLSYEDMVYEIIELAKHDMIKMIRLCEAILKTPEIATPIEQYFMEIGD